MIKLIIKTLNFKTVNLSKFSYLFIYFLWNLGWNGHLWKKRSPLGSTVTFSVAERSWLFLNQDTWAPGLLGGGLQVSVTVSPLRTVMFVGCCTKLQCISETQQLHVTSEQFKQHNWGSLWLRVYDGTADVGIEYQLEAGKLVVIWWSPSGLMLHSDTNPHPRLSHSWRKQKNKSEIKLLSSTSTNSILKHSSCRLWSLLFS